MAVYTPVSEEDLADFLRDYDLGHPVSLEGIAQGVENSNYRLETDTGHYVLTLFERRVNPADLPYFLALMDHLAARELPCPRPVRRHDGAMQGTLCGRRAAIVTFLPGETVGKPLANHAAQAGAMLARLHLAGGDFAGRRTNHLGPAGWRGLFDGMRGRLDELRDGLEDDSAAWLDDIIADWPTGLIEGTIHADLFPDNVLFDDNRLTGVIDFYFACTDVYAYDLAIMLNAWGFTPEGTFLPELAAALFEGYGRERPLMPAERDAMPLLAQGAAMRFFLTRAHDWLNQVPGALVTVKNPLDYEARLRFHRGIRDPSAYGL
jgi:homoserine kinase type II